MHWIIIFFFIFLIMLCLSQLARNTFMLGLCLLIIGILVFITFCILNLTWYACIVHLVLNGGLLVIFFYIISINSNQLVGSISLSSNEYSIFLIFSFMLLFLFSTYSLESIDLFLFSFFEDNSFLLFNSNEVFFTVILGIFLIFTLFVVSLLTSSLSGALRPISIF